MGAQVNQLHSWNKSVKKNITSYLCELIDGRLASFLNGPIPASFCLFFVFSTLHNLINWWKCIRRAWDSNPGRQDGRHMWIHWAMAAPLVNWLLYLSHLKDQPWLTQLHVDQKFLPNFVTFFAANCYNFVNKEKNLLSRPNTNFVNKKFGQSGFDILKLHYYVHYIAIIYIYFATTNDTASIMVPVCRSKLIIRWYKSPTIM